MSTQTRIRVDRLLRHHLSSTKDRRWLLSLIIAAIGRYCTEEEIAHLARIEARCGVDPDNPDAEVSGQLRFRFPVEAVS